MKANKDIPRSRWLRVDPNNPSLNPGYLSTMTWKPKAAVLQAEKALKTPLFKSLARFIFEAGLLEADESILNSLRTFIEERIDQFTDVGITLHPSSFLIRNRQMHGIATLSDGQRLFLSYFHGNPPPLKGVLRFSWKIEVRNSLQIQLSPVDLANLRIFLEKIGPEFAPVAPRGTGVGLGNRMVTLDYPVAYEVIKRYGLCVGVIQGSVFREMVPEKMFHRRSPPAIDLPGIGLIPAGHTGSSVQGQFVAGMVYRIQRGIDLPIVADADHIPIRGTSRRAMKDTRMLIEEAKDRTLFTLDPHFCLYGGNPVLQSDLGLLDKTFQSFPEERQVEILERYADREFQIKNVSGDGSFPIYMSRENVIDAAVRFEEAIKAIAETWSVIENVKAGRPYAVEVSIDEASGMTEPHHFFYLASELVSLSLKPFSLAPGLGFTKRDLDLEEPKAFFEERVRQLASIAHKFGIILGIHSGDGKGFATKKILAQATGGHFWYKISPDRQRNLFKTISRFPQGSFERTLYEDLFDWTLCYVLRLSLEAHGETAQSAREAIEEILEQDTVTAQKIRRKFKDVLRCINTGEDHESLLADMERIVRSPSSDLRRDPNSRVIHDYAFIYVGQRSQKGGFLHRGRFFAISDEAAKSYQEADRSYINEMLEALALTD